MGPPTCNQFPAVATLTVQAPTFLTRRLLCWELRFNTSCWDPLVWIRSSPHPDSPRCAILCRHLHSPTLDHHASPTWHRHPPRIIQGFGTESSGREKKERKRERGITVFLLILVITVFFAGLPSSLYPFMPILGHFPKSTSVETREVTQSSVCVIRITAFCL